jgi:hypothetical protein
MSNTNREASLITYFNQAKTLYMYKTLYELAAKQGQTTVRQELKDAPTQHLIARLWGQQQLIRDGYIISPSAVQQVQTAPPQEYIDPKIITTVNVSRYYNDGNPTLTLSWGAKPNAVRYTIYDKEGNVRAVTTDTTFTFRKMSTLEESLNNIVFGALKSGQLLQFQVRPTYLEDTQEVPQGPHKYYTRLYALIYKPIKAVTTLDLSIGGDRIITATWSLPSGIESSYPIEFFIVQYSLDPTFSVYNEVIQYNLYGSSAFSVSLNDLIPGETYHVRVKGSNEVGDGPYDNRQDSRSEDSIIAIGIPQVAPTISHNIVRDGGEGRANISWSNIASTAYPVSEYIWEIKDKNGILEENGAGLETHVMGFRMTEGIEYTISVKARNNAGISPIISTNKFIYYLEPGVPDIRAEYKSGKISLLQNYRDIRSYIDSPTAPITRIVIQNVSPGRDIVITGQNLYNQLLVQFRPDFDVFYNIKIIVGGRGGDTEIFIPIKIITPGKEYIKTTALVHGDRKFQVSWTISGSAEEVIGYRVLYEHNNEYLYADINGGSVRSAVIEIPNGKLYNVRLSVRRYTSLIDSQQSGVELTNPTVVGTVLASGRPAPPVLGNHVLGVLSNTVELKWTPIQSISGEDVTGYRVTYSSGSNNVNIPNSNASTILINNLINHSPYTFRVYTRGRLRTQIDSSGYAIGPVLDNYIYSDPIDVTLTPYSPVPSPTIVTTSQYSTAGGRPAIDISWENVQAQLENYKYLVKYSITKGNTILLSGEHLTTQLQYSPDISGDYYGYTINVTVAGTYSENELYVSKTPYNKGEQLVPLSVTELIADTTSLYNITTVSIKKDYELVLLKWTMDAAKEHLRGFRIRIINAANGMSTQIQQLFPFTYVEEVTSISKPFTDNVSLQDIQYKVYKYSNTYFAYVYLSNAGPNIVNLFSIDKVYQRDNLIYYSPAKSSNTIQFYGIINEQPELISITKN